MRMFGLGWREFIVGERGRERRRERGRRDGKRGRDGGREAVLIPRTYLHKSGHNYNHS